LIIWSSGHLIWPSSHFAISPFRHLAISPFRHLVISPFGHLAIWSSLAIWRLAIGGWGGLIPPSCFRAFVSSRGVYKTGRCDAAGGALLRQDRPISCAKPQILNGHAI
jgi:hypothetical protein